MLKATDMHSFEPIYTFIDNEGTNINIASARLRVWCKENKPEIVLTPVDRKLARTFITENCVSRVRCAQLLRMPKHLMDPILFALAPPDRPSGKPYGYLVDGHHRYVCHAAAGYPEIFAHMLTPAQWHPFQVEGLKDLTKQQLRDIPILPRHY